MQICKQPWCQKAFEILPEDREFLGRLAPVIAGKSIPLPDPTLCPDCRQQRRVATGNMFNLYERTCDLTGKKIISMYSPDSPYKVYNQPDWYSDKWDALEYGREFDFSRPFFEQFHELDQVVPKQCLLTGYEYDENSAYTNHAGKNKNCYLIFDSDENWDSYYSFSINHCKNCMDCFRTFDSELCFQCVDCVQCYGSMYLQDSDNCTDSAFLKNCIGCKRCLMCSNLRNKEYYIENKQATKEEFERFRKLLGSAEAAESARVRFEQLKLEYPQKCLHGVQNENVFGDYLVSSKDSYFCFDSENLWDCRYIYQGFMPLKNCMDIQEAGEAELLYECAFVGYGMQSSAFCRHSLSNNSNLLYCISCYHSKNLFGCNGVLRKSYCILNKQYTKDEYESLVPKIIDHMKTTGEWGEFFPIQHSSFGYNETLAQDFFPLSKDEVLSRSWKWSEAVEKKDAHPGPFAAVPDSIDDADESLTKNIFQCEKSGKAYKIIAQELALAKQMHVPLPRKTFLERHRVRNEMRNPRALYERSCGKCGRQMVTSYPPERLEVVYCEECYLKAVD